MQQIVHIHYTQIGVFEKGVKPSWELEYLHRKTLLDLLQSYLPHSVSSY